MSANSHIPPIQCLLTFEALARSRSVTKAAEELRVTPGAVSHRVKHLEQIVGNKLFSRADFSLTTEGSEYLAHVREGLLHVREALVSLKRFPSASNTPVRRKLRLAVTPTFARSVLMPRLKHFLDAYPEIDITVQVSIPSLDVVAEDADLTVRFGTGHYSDMEHICLAKDDVTPFASPAWLRENGPFANVDDLQRVPLLRSPLEPWRTWFAAHDLDWPEPLDGSSFNDIGLMCDAAVQGLGVGLIRTKLGAPWVESGQLVRLFERSVPSPHAHYLCWRSGIMDRWECATFADWLKKALA